MSLYQKHRPNNLKEMYGNKTLLVTLKNMIKNKESIPHAILFYGETGTGKTTLARIIANELGCNRSNLVEVNAANFNGVDTMREVIKTSQYIPLNGNVRVYIFDEIHKMTSAAQEAFLKPLEDTPKHVYFILCTTNEKSLLPTVRGRCSQFQTTMLSDEDMTSLLEKVIVEEKQEIEKKIVQTIVKSAAGHPRNALTILEQVIAANPKQRKIIAEHAQIVEATGFELAQQLFKGASWNVIAKLLQGLKDQDAEAIRRIILGYQTTILLKGFNTRAAHILECFEEPFYNIGFPGLVLACARVYQRKV